MTIAFTMTTHTETRLGLTPTFKRLAYFYLTKGVGSYPLEHPVYDRVEVSALYDWKKNPVVGDASNANVDNSEHNAHGAGLVVSFYRGFYKVRWVEFGIRCIGGGGDSAIFAVSNKA